MGRYLVDESDVRVRGTTTTKDGSKGPFFRSAIDTE